MSNCFEPPALEAELAAFEALKPRLRTLWSEVFPHDDQPYTSVIVPSVTIDPGEPLQKPGAIHFEESLLFLLIRLRNPRARVVYVTSVPIAPTVLEYYLQFLVGVPASHARNRVTLLSVQDYSPRPLTQKILERPRVVERIRAAIFDPSRAYLTVLRSTPLERRLAVVLGIPLNAADPGTDALYGKSTARVLAREAGIPVPLGREEVRGESEIVDAVAFLRSERPALRRVVLKRNTATWEQGHALMTLPAGTSSDDTRRALRQLAFSTPGETPQTFMDRFNREAGVVEEFIDSTDLGAASVQLRINPLGKVSLTSTHEELRGGPLGMATTGCLFPAADSHRTEIQRAALRIGGLLAARGLVSRVSIEFLVWEGGRNIAVSEINLGFGGTTHPLLAVRLLTGGELDPETGLFRSPSGRPKYYRATDQLMSEKYRGLLPEDLIETSTLNKLSYSQRDEAGALFYMLGALSEHAWVGMVAIGNSRDEADAVYRQAVEALDVAGRCA
jgi:hypothetical protein